MNGCLRDTRGNLELDLELNQPRFCPKISSYDVRHNDVIVLFKLIYVIRNS